MKKILLPLIVLLNLQFVLGQGEYTRPYVAPENMVKGGQFIDRFLPMEINAPLTYDVWGGDNVVPRDAANGMEDQDHSYWGGNIIKGDDGKYHMFPCRWRQDATLSGNRSGHMCWGSSEVVHAIADKPTGPYKVKEVIGKGHNPEIYRKKDGTYTIGVLGKKAYTAPTLNGPWTQIEASTQWLVCERNFSNRTYVVREDGAALVMAKDGRMHFSENADEKFIQLNDNELRPICDNSIMEDPVMWKDEVQYNCIFNDAIGRTAYYMRSADGIHWKYERGVAYNPRIFIRKDGSYEDWFKAERPKILQDEYGRATHMNFAVMDAHKRDDKANDNHSSKNIVMALRVPCRMQILNEERLTKETKEIKLKILAEEGFNPNDLDIQSLKFGAPETVDFGGGANAVSSEKSGNDLIVTFSGDGNGFNDDNFAAKLIGTDKKGELVFGYAKMKASPTELKDEIEFNTILDEIPISGKVKFAVYHRTKQERLLHVELTSKGKIIASKQIKVNGSDISVVNFDAGKPLSLNNKYEFKLYLSPLKGKKALSEMVTKEVIPVPENAPQDAIVKHNFPDYIPESGKIKFEVDYEAKTERDLCIEFYRRTPNRELLTATKLKTVVPGKNTTVVELDIPEAYKVTEGNEYIIYMFLSEKGGNWNHRRSNNIRIRMFALKNEDFKNRFGKFVSE